MVKAVVLEERDKLSLRDIKVEETLGRRDVRIGLRNIGICGSDVHYYTHGRIGPFEVRAPMILGHEASGVILEVGTDVTSSRKATGSAWSRASPTRPAGPAASASTTSILPCASGRR